MVTNDASRPSSLRNPPQNCTTRMAKLILQSGIDRHSTFKILCVDARHDLSLYYSLTRYLLAKNNVNKSINIHDISRKEAEEASNLLIYFLVAENIPFSIFGLMENFPRLLWTLLNFLRPGCPALSFLKDFMIQKYHGSITEAVKRDLKDTTAM